jgi:hypothetical protein
MLHKTLLLGSPGSSKSTCGLSYPGVEQHVWGSNEEDTAASFKDSGNILPFLKPDWFECLSDVEKAKFTDEKTSEVEIGQMTKVARAKNIAKYRRYLYAKKAELLKMDEKTQHEHSIFLDNLTPFALEFQDYVEIVYASEFTTKEGNFNSIKFSMKYQQEISDFLRFMVSIPCHIVVSSHISMAVDEETAAKANFMTDAQKGIKYAKEWQPLIMGKSKYVLPGLFTFAFFLWSEDSPGQLNKYYGKLEADSASVGVAKSRVQPFSKPSKIEIPKCGFFKMLDEELSKYNNNTTKESAK